VRAQGGDDGLDGHLVCGVSYLDHQIGLGEGRISFLGMRLQNLQRILPRYEGAMVPARHAAREDLQMRSIQLIETDFAHVGSFSLNPPPILKG